MDFLKRLSDYDLFGYLPAGLVVMAFLQYMIIPDASFGADLTAFEIILWLIFAYAIGHLVAIPSARLLERGLVKGLLGHPMLFLTGQIRSGILQRMFFPGFGEPLDEFTLAKVNAKIAAANVDPMDGEAMFGAAYLAARSDEYTKGRIAAFSNLYGFCRNMTTAGLFMCLVLLGTLIAAKFNRATAPGGTLVVLAFAAILTYGMLLRFLKFYRLYGREILVNYAK